MKSGMNEEVNKIVNARKWINEWEYDDNWQKPKVNDPIDE